MAYNHKMKNGDAQFMTDKCKNISFNKTSK